MKYSYIILTTIAILFSSCEEKEVIIPKWEAPTGNKVVLVEELTGVRCTNCPTGNKKLQGLEEQYGDKLIVVGIHGSQLTQPVKDGDYDLKNEFSIAIEDYLQPFVGKPAAGIDRIAFESPDFAISGYDLWPGYIEKAFKKEALIDLTLHSTWNEDTRAINLMVTLSPQKADLPGVYKLSVMLVESEITTDQKGPSGLIEGYVHHNVLRTMLTNFDGDEVGISKDQYGITEQQYTHTLADEDGTWIADHMDIVVFITDKESKEIIQAKKIKVIK